MQYLSLNLFKKIEYEIIINLEKNITNESQLKWKLHSIRKKDLETWSFESLKIIDSLIKKKKPISIQNRIQTGFHDGSSLLIFSTELATNLVTVHKILRLLRESS